MEDVLSDTESNKTVLADGWDDDPAEEDDRISEADAGFIDGAEESEEEEAPFRLPGVAILRGAFASLDDVNLVEEFDERACVMKSVPRFMQGPYRIAMRVALQEMNSADEVQVERGWKLFLLLPRLLLYRAPRGGLIPRAKLMSRLELFNRGDWRQLLEASRNCCHQAAVLRRRRNRRSEDDITRRVNRAESLVHMGELSSARQALEGASLAPGSDATLNALRDPVKRPRFPRRPIPQELVSLVPEVEFNLDDFRFARNLRSAKKGAAGGPSGMTVEHLQPLLGHPRDLRNFIRVCEQLSRARVPHPIREAIRLGRFTALQKPSGHREKVSGAYHVTTIDVRSPERHSTFPVRIGDEEWMREHRSCSTRPDRVESAHHCNFHRRH